MSQRPPVKDWATDFDHLDQRWINDPFPIWDDMRKRCPIAHTDRFMGVYFPRATRTCAPSPTTRSISPRAASSCARRRRRAFPAPPITSDPPEHRPARMVLLPPFTPDAMKKLEPRARALANELIDKFAKRGSADAAVEYAQEIPVRLIAHMLGLPEADGNLYRKWIKMVLEDGITDSQHRRRGRRRDDALLHGLRARAHGEAGRRPDQLSHQGAGTMASRCSMENVIGSLRLLLIAGIDTTWSGIGSCIWHLATHPRIAAASVAEPALMPTAIEEFLRAYAPVTMAREVVKETELNGCTFKPGQMVLLCRSPPPTAIPPCSRTPTR